MPRSAPLRPALAIKGASAVGRNHFRVVTLLRRTPRACACPGQQSRRNPKERANGKKRFACLLALDGVAQQAMSVSRNSARVATHASFRKRESRKGASFGRVVVGYPTNLQSGSATRFRRANSAFATLVPVHTKGQQYLDPPFGCFGRPWLPHLLLRVPHLIPPAPTRKLTRTDSASSSLRLVVSAHEA
jgi:hypothetical protein